MRLLLFLSIIFVLLLLSCSKQNKKESIKTIDLDSLPENLHNIVRELERDSQIGERNENYNGLLETASIEQLMALTNHKNVVVRCTAFKVLRFRSPDKVFPILLNHLNDTISVVERGSGCISQGYRAGDYFIYISFLRMNENDSIILTGNQIEIIDSILRNDTSIRLLTKGIPEFVQKK